MNEFKRRNRYSPHVVLLTSCAPPLTFACKHNKRQSSKRVHPSRLHPSCLAKAVRARTEVNRNSQNQQDRIVLREERRVMKQRLKRILLPRDFLLHNR